VANRKLPPSLILAKARAPKSGCSTPYLHFITTVSHKTDQCALVCESQSKVTRRDRVYRRPRRRPERPAQGF